MCLAGAPAHTEYGGTSLVTTDPAPMTAPSPIVTPPIIIHFIPIHTSLPIVMFPLFGVEIWGQSKPFPIENGNVDTVSIL